MSTYVRLLAVSVACDAAFKQVGGFPYSAATLADKDNIFSTTLAVQNNTFSRDLWVVNQLKSDFCQPLKKCPDTDRLREWRTNCFPDACRDDEIYHCGEEEISGNIVEFCSRRFHCDEGSYGLPVLNGEKVHLSCKPCPEGRFNPQRRPSPENMDQCKAHFHAPPERNTVIFSPGNSSHPAVFYCNASAGWASKHGTLFCKPSYQPCDCKYHINACPGEELLPDKRCVPKCNGERLPEQNFSCILKKDFDVESRQLQRQESTTFASTISEIPERNKESDGQPLGNHTTLILSLISVSLICFVLLLILIYFIDKKSTFPTIIKKYISRTTVKGDVINLTGEQNTLISHHKQPSDEISHLTDEEKSNNE